MLSVGMGFADTTAKKSNCAQSSLVLAFCGMGLSE